MKNLRYPFVALTAGVLLLAGCSTGSGDGTETSAQPSAAPSEAANGANGMPQGAMPGGGVSGEIVFAQDGTLQVQDGSSQTAVRYTDATTVSERVEIALADVSVGSCVVAITDDSGAATSVTVTDPVNGECTTGLGGMGFPGGDGQRPDGAPSGAPTAMPDAGDAPTDMPTAFPSGAPGDGDFPGGDFAGSFVTGTVAAVSSTGFTVTTSDGTSEVAIGSDSTITGTQDADASAIAVGLCVTAQGQADTTGGFDATALTLSQKGDDGCSTRGFGGMGGGPRGGGSDNENNG